MDAASSSSSSRKGKGKRSDKSSGKRQPTTTAQSTASSTGLSAAEDSTLDIATVRQLGLLEPIAPEPRDASSDSATDEGVDDDQPGTSTGKRARKPHHYINLSEKQKNEVVEFLKIHPELYSKRLSTYKDRNIAQRLWGEVGANIGVDGNSVKTWYKSMRTTLGRVKRIMTKSGSGAGQMTETRRWVWQKFQFLVPHIESVSSRALGLHPQPELAPLEDDPEEEELLSDPPTPRPESSVVS
ncbi:hypothetical protein ACOMHN_005610 [Nucella lapillus]